MKRRKQPAGVLGRPRSPLPLKARRKLEREKYRMKLAARGLRSVRLLLRDAATIRLQELARQRGVQPGEVVNELLARAD